MFAYLRSVDEPDADLDLKVEALADAGHPTVTLSVHGPIDLGRIFFFAEFAIAVAGWVLEINPFDQPNVQEAKDNTNRVLQAYAEAGALPERRRRRRRRAAGAAVGRRRRRTTSRPRLPPGVGGVRRRRGRSATCCGATGCATTFGYGPRFQHSTGQYHKGGPKTGVFLQLVHDGDEDVECRAPATPSAR